MENQDYILTLINGEMKLIPARKKKRKPNYEDLIIDGAKFPK